LSSFSSFSNGNAMPVRVRQPGRKALLNLVVAWWRRLFILWMESKWRNQPAFWLTMTWWLIGSLV
jgi:hypothetical protein